MQIREKVKFLVNKHQTNDPFRLAKALGIIVMYENLGNILGYYSRTYRYKVIHINENSSENLQMFTCGHELGHAILHPDTNTSFLKSNTYFSTDKIEYEANRFALELLLNDNPIAVKEAIALYEVSEQALIKKFFP